MPECDWGSKDNHGLILSPNFMVDAVALAELNTLYGERLLAAGNSQEAIATWLKGLTFAEHIDQGFDSFDTAIAFQVANQAFHLPPAQTATKLEQLVTELKHPVVVHIPNLIWTQQRPAAPYRAARNAAGGCGLRKAIVFQKDTKIVV